MFTSAKVACLALAILGMAAHSAGDKAIDVERSTITIHVGKSGAFSAAGHEHVVKAPIAEGSVHDSISPRVEFKVRAASMKVQADSKADTKDQVEVQKNMQESVLESAKYPEIAFRSSQVEKQGDGQWKVSGVLTLHGASKPVAMTVKQTGNVYVGHATILQSDFGIKPIRAAGGMVKVNDALEIEFRVVTR